MKNLKKKLVIVLCIFIFALVNINTVRYAAVAVTKENLKITLQKYVTSKENENKYLISVEDSLIKITAEGKTYNLNYDLKDNPTFKIEIPIKKGMSYKEFEDSSNNLSLPMIGYAAVCDIQGVSYEDSLSNFLMSYLGSAFNSILTNGINQYIIVDDLNPEEGVTLEKTNDSKTIYTSEFGDRVMEYVDSLYSKKFTVSDANSFNSYSMTIEKKDETENSCKIVSELKVNMNGDFDKMKGYVDTISEAMKDSIKIGEKQNEGTDEEKEDTSNNIAKTENATSSENKSNIENTNTEAPIKDEEEKIENKVKEIPNAGIDNKFKNIVAVIIVFSVIALITINIKKMKNNNE